MTTARANQDLGTGSCGVGAGVGWGVGEAKVTQGRKSKAQVPCLGYAVRCYLKITKAEAVACWYSSCLACCVSVWVPWGGGRGVVVRFVCVKVPLVHWWL